MSHSPHVTAIVAATLENGIGKDGGLPWRLPGEMKYFQRVTLGAGSLSASASAHDTPPPNAVIMGRKTWESIPPKFRPLGGRRNLIITRSPESVSIGAAAHTSLHTSLPGAIASSSSSSSSFSSSTTSTTFLIGGAQLYAEALSASPPLVSRVLLTRVLSGPAPKPISAPTDAPTPTPPTAPILCDAFLHDFPSDRLPSGQPVWRLAPHSVLEAYVGFDVPAGEVHEKGFTYRFELWERTRTDNQAETDTAQS